VWWKYFYGVKIGVETGIRNWFVDNLMIVESDGENAIFCHDMWLWSGSLCNIFRRPFELFQKNYVPFEEMRRLRLDGVEIMS
jgi:hypothetical protein